MKRSPVSEFLMNALVECPATGLRNRVKYAALSRLRNFTANHRNRLVRYKLEGVDLLLPLSHQLPIYRRTYREYSANIGRLAGYVKTKYPEEPIIDIGANVGDTIAIIRAMSSAPILAIEGDEFYFRLLLENLKQAKLQNVDPVQAFVGVAPVMQGALQRVGGTASFVAGGPSSVLPIPMEQIVAKYPRFERSKLLKIDTDGFDCQIVESSLGWLASAKPLTFIEYDPTLTMKQGVESKFVFELLRSIGYKYAIFWKNTGDYLLTAELCNSSLLEDLDAHCSASGSYLDIAFVHEEDTELGLRIRKAEMIHFGANHKATHLAQAFSVSARTLI